jgi:protein-disulfide isomerase
MEENKVDGSQNQNSYLVPASIIVAGLLIAFAVVYTNGAPGVKNQEASGGVIATGEKGKDMRPVDSTDYILGNPDAPIKIVEYSDLECPFCKTYHPTLKKIMSEYGKDGKVAWVYRHLPLDSIHPKARKEAEAAECAGELGGNNAFWAYIDKVFEITPANNRLEASELPKIAEQIGISRTAFESCLTSGRNAEKVEADFQDAIKAGGDGTPYTVITTSSGKVYPFSGALPYDQVKGILDEAISSL